MCQAHYTRDRRGKSLSEPVGQYRGRRSKAEIVSSLSKRNETTGCVEIQSYLDKDGYGRVRYEGSLTLAHRMAWEAKNGTIPEGAVIDHLCHNRACVNVDHLRMASLCLNQQNRKGANRNNGSGYRNVYWHKRDKRWLVRLNAYGKTYNGGRFASAEEANLAAIKLREAVLKETPALPQ